MLSIIFWVLMIIVATLMLITNIDNLVTARKVNKLQRKLYEAKIEAVITKSLLNIAKDNLSDDLDIDINGKKLEINDIIANAERENRSVASILFKN